MWNRSHSRKKLVGPIPTPKNFLGPIPPHKKTFWDLFQLLKKIVGLFPPLNFTIGTISTFTKFQWDLFHSSFFLMGHSPQPPLSHPTSGVGRESRDGKFPGIPGFFGFPFPGKTWPGSREKEHIKKALNFVFNSIFLT